MRKLPFPAVFVAAYTSPVDSKPRPLEPWSGLSIADRADAPPDGPFGIVCGLSSLVVIDIDRKNGVDGLDAYTEHLAPHLAGVNTLTVSTKNGGFHIYLWHPEADTVRKAVGIYPGIDLQAHASLAWGWGCDGYSIAVDAPVARLPDALFDILPKVDPTRAQAPAPGQWIVTPLDSTEAAQAVRDAASRIPGDNAERLRSLVHASGRRFVRVAGASDGPETPKGVDATLLSMFIDLWTAAPELDPASVMGAADTSLRRFIRDDLDAGNPTYSLDDIESKMNRAAHIGRARAAERKETSDAIALVAKTHLYAKRDSFRLDIEQGNALPPLMSMRKGHYFVRHIDGTQYVTAHGDTLHATLENHVPDLQPFTDKGAARPVSQLVAEQFAQLDRHVRILGGESWRYDPADATLFEPVANLAASPAYVPEIESWLDIIDPDRRARQWLGTFRQLTTAAPALWFIGGPAWGKSLFAVGAAGMFGESPTSMDHALSDFPADLIGCPVVNADESIPRDWRGRPMIDKFKALVTDTRRRINIKYQPPCDLLGAVRVIVSTNSADSLNTTLTRADAEAISDRVLAIAPAPAAQAESRKYLESIRPSVQTKWIASNLLARHFAYVALNEPLPEARTRLAVPADPGPLAAELRSSMHSEAHAVAQAIADLLLAHAAGQHTGCHYHPVSGFGVREQAIKGRLDMVGGGRLAYLRKNIRRFVTGERFRVGTLGYRPIDIDALRQWATDVDGDVTAGDIDTALATLGAAQ